MGWHIECIMYILDISFCYSVGITLMPIDNIYVLDHGQAFLNEPLHNIYTFNRSTTGVAIDLINAFIEDLLPAIQDLQCEQIVTTTIKAYSLGDLADLNEVTVNTVGANAGADMLPVFNAINFSLKPTSRAVRPGSKRISGIPEGAQEDGTITEVPYLAFMDTLRDLLGSNISDDDAAFWQPVVVKRVPYVVEGSDPERVAYRYPETDAELVFATLRNVTTTTKVSHQVSRGN